MPDKYEKIKRDEVDKSIRDACKNFSYGLAQVIALMESIRLLRKIADRQEVFGNTWGPR